ncbi:MAG: ACT domain-containing protein [Clostridia bacterium]|jgi:ACT domain-containing protein|uniref:ACT domain-containing protein n=1 Tax=Pumilibacter muris TaxID=2941510 RepID=UPI00203FB8EB|nr:ACT domain-containing protein [Pumilibacter muris]MCI8596698.1 ACT domain-containing protein [Clostridia bacterium]
MKAVVTVVGKDKSGIIARVTEFLANKGANVEDISQTVLQNYFAMIMLVETGSVQIGEFRKGAEELGKSIGVDISIQHEDVFSAMHRI